MKASAPSPIRFGPFEVLPQSGELRRNGLYIRLQDQPFQALVLMLERPGEVVTREEFRRRLWHENTFVDFDRGLTKAINRLRDALRDDAEKPRFIETLSHRGYRFIGDIATAEVRAETSAHSTSVIAVPAYVINSLAVLPLVNLSGDPGEEYFSDGMTEELIGAACNIRSLRVISRTSMMTYKGSKKSLPDIAKELHVDAVVEGSVTRSGEKVRIIAQLIHAGTDTHLWAGRYERDLAEVLQLQAEIAAAIAAQIQKVLDPTHLLRARSRQVHPRAYEAWLKGNFLRDQMTPDALLKSTRFFDQALELDPAYAQAYGDLAQAYFYLGLFGAGHPLDMFSRAKSNALQALALDKEVPIAHNALAAVHVSYDWNWAAAEAECRRAVELSPGVSATHVHLADYVSIRGRHEEAIAEYLLALELDPISRVNVGHFGLLLYRAGRFEEFIEQCRKALEIDPHYVNARWFLALSLEQVGRSDEAMLNLREIATLSGAPHLRALLARAYALNGERSRALEILDDLTAISAERYISPFDLAVIHVGMDELDAAFQQFEQAYEQHVFRMVELNFAMYAGLRTDPRWQNLVERIGLLQ